MLIKRQLQQMNGRLDSRLDEPRMKLLNSFNKTLFGDQDKFAAGPDWAGKEGFLNKLGLDESKAASLFRSMLGNGDFPAELGKNKRLSDKVSNHKIITYTFM